MFLFTATITGAQSVIPLPYEELADLSWKQPQKEYFSSIWNTNAVTNVSSPSLLWYPPKEGTANDMAIIIAPGGGFYALSINEEGRNVAGWLTERGFSVFVLQYRLVPTGNDGVQELADILATNNQERIRITHELLPFAIKDGLTAVSHVRENAVELGVDPTKIGFLGFSAGGVVGLGVINGYIQEDRPDFVSLVYPGTDLIDPIWREGLPKIQIIAAADDGGRSYARFYDILRRTNENMDFHLFTAGGHGFASRVQGLPVDYWKDRLYEWVLTEDLLGLVPDPNDDDNDGVDNVHDLCPGTALGSRVNTNGCEIFTISADNFKIRTKGESCKASNDGTITITSEEATLQFNAEIQETNDVTDFTTEATFTDLVAGDYTVCITTTADANYEQCFNATVLEPEDLSVTSKVNSSKNQVTLNLRGGSNYSIELNGETTETTENEVVLLLQNGLNSLMVKADKDCQGKYEELIGVFNDVTIFPNAVKEEFTIWFANKTDSKVNLQVISAIGRIIINKTEEVTNQSIEVNAQHLRAGMYFVKVKGENIQSQSKIIKK